jgi:hypothetical protein
MRLFILLLSLRSLALKHLGAKLCSALYTEKNIVVSVFTQAYIYLLTYLRSWALLEEPPIVQPLKNFAAFYGTRRFNTVFTRSLHWSLSWAISIQSTPSRPISLRSILILSTHLRLGLPSGLFPPGFPYHNPASIPLLPIRVTCPHRINLKLLILILHGEEHRLWRVSLWHFVPPSSIDMEDIQIKL